MRVLIIHNRYREPGGEEHAVGQLERLLKARRHDVVLFEKKSQDWNEAGPLEKIKSASRVPFSRPVYKELETIITQQKPDVIHVHNIFPFMTPSIYYAADKKNIPVVQTLHNFRLFCSNGLLLRNRKPCELCVTGNVFFGALHRCYQGKGLPSTLMAGTLFLHRKLKTWNNKVDCFLALSEFSENLFKKSGLPHDKIKILRNAVPVPNEPPRDSVSLLTAPLVFIGRLSQEKGVATLLQAYKLFFESGFTVPLEIIGDGPKKSAVESFKNENPALPINFHGPLFGEEKDRILSQAGYLLFPSECYENCPYAILDAFSKGVPVIASSLGGIPELVQPSRTGYLFNPGSVNDLVDQLKKAYENESNWKKMRDEVYHEARQRFNEEEWIKEIEKVYASVS